MAVYSCSVRTTNNTNNNAALEIRSPGTTDQLQLLEVMITIVNGNTSVFGLGVPAAAGQQSTANTNSVQDDNAVPLGTGLFYTAWNVAPTIPTNFYRRGTTANQVGGGITWTFRGGGYGALGGLIVPPQSSVVIWNLGANNDFTDVHVTWNE